MINLENEVLVFCHSIKISEKHFPKIWKLWSSLGTWSQWDTSLENVEYTTENLYLGKTFKVLPKGADTAIPVIVTSFIQNMHFTTSSFSTLGTLSIGHTIVNDEIEHTICIKPTNYHFFKENIWKTLQKNLQSSMDSLVELVKKETIS